MKELRYVITDEVGLHARPAGLFVSAASKFVCKIRMISGTKDIDGKSILAVMSMALKKGDEMHLVFEGEDEEKAYEAMQAFLKENL